MNQRMSQVLPAVWWQRCRVHFLRSIVDYLLNRNSWQSILAVRLGVADTVRQAQSHQAGVRDVRRGYADASTCQKVPIARAWCRP